jgi:chromosome segregation ATPase
MPKENTKQEWIPATKTVSKPILVPEPKHRILNRGKMNLSIREFPSSKSSAQQIKDICIHYVKKCSGQYLMSKTAARYVHQMADEVLNQISGLISQINRMENEPDNFLKLIQDFKEVFPSSSITPKLLSQKLSQLTEENKTLREQIANQKQEFQTEIAHISTSISEQINAYRSSISHERDFNSEKTNDMINHMNIALQQQREQIQSEQADKDNNIKNLIMEIQSKYQTQIANLEAELGTAKENAENYRRKLRDSNDELKLQNTSIMHLKSKLAKFEDDEIRNAEKYV